MNQWLLAGLITFNWIGFLITVENCVKLIANRGKEIK